MVMPRDGGIIVLGNGNDKGGVIVLCNGNARGCWCYSSR